MLVCRDRHDQGCKFENPNTATQCLRCGRSLATALTLADPGATIGAYRVVRMIGYGGFGAVYEAQDGRGQVVALKESLDVNSMAAFASEFDVMARLQHPGLPRYYDLFNVGTSAYLVMEYISGTSLEALLHDRGGALPLADVLVYAAQLCEALAYLHANRVVHRDVKPQNVIVRAAAGSSHAVLVDLGLFKIAGHMTRTVAQAVSAGYSALENYSANGSTDERSDVYALAATLYRASTGLELLEAPRRLRSPDLPGLSGLPQPIASALQTALALNADDRFPSIETFAQALFSQPARSSAGAPTVSLQPAAPSASRVLLAGGQVIRSLAFGAGGKQLYGGVAEGLPEHWDLDRGAAAGRPLVPTWRTDARALPRISSSRSADGRTDLLACAGEGTVLVWSKHTGLFAPLTYVDQGRPCTAFSGHARVAYSPDGLKLAVSDRDMSVVRLWPQRGLSASTRLLQTGAFSGEVRDLFWNDDGGRVWAWLQDRHALRFVWWDMQFADLVEVPFSGVLDEAPSGTDPVTLAAAGGQGQWIVVATRDGVLWRRRTTVTSGMRWEVLERAPNTRRIAALALAPGYPVLAAAIDDALVLFHLERGERVGVFGLRETVACLAWAPGGRMLVAGTRQGCAVLTVWGS